MNDDKTSQPSPVKKFLELPASFLRLPARTFLEGGGRVDGEALLVAERRRPPSMETDGWWIDVASVDPRVLDTLSDLNQAVELAKAEGCKWICFDLDMRGAKVGAYLDISTAHIPPSVGELLDAGGLDGNSGFVVTVDQRRFQDGGRKGWWVLVSDPANCEGMPEELRRVVDYAREQGCEWICIDRDGAIITELVTSKPASTEPSP